jgi:G:T-mismatch repair DNA endonuclease (very short patch repair protein)
MPLRLSAEGAKTVDEWRSRPRTSPGDEQLVAEVLKALAGRSWQLRWHHYDSPADPDIITIQPREGLFLHVRLWDGGDAEEFTVVSITDTGVAADE